MVLVRPTNPNGWEKEDHKQWKNAQLEDLRRPDGTVFSLLRTPVSRRDPVFACLCNIGYTRCDCEGFRSSSSAGGLVRCCDGSSKPCRIQHDNEHNDASFEWMKIHKACPCRLQYCKVPIARGFRKCKTPDCMRVCVFGVSGRSVFCIECSEKKHSIEFEPRECIARPLKSLDKDAKKLVVHMRIKYEVHRFLSSIDLVAIIASYALPDFDEKGVFNKFL
jgi:hypothetical protein